MLSNGKDISEVRVSRVKAAPRAIIISGGFQWWDFKENAFADIIAASSTDFL